MHASGQVVAFEFDWRHGPEDLGRALNANLPADVAVRSVAECPPEFHPRYSARAQHCSRPYNRPVRSPLAARYSSAVWPALDLAAMQQASVALLGRHDFATLAPTPTRGATRCGR